MCGLERETVKHYLLICPRFAAQCSDLLTSAAQVCGQGWLASSDNEKVKLMLKGSAQLSYFLIPIWYCPNDIFLDTCRFS